MYNPSPFLRERSKRERVMYQSESVPSLSIFLEEYIFRACMYTRLNECVVDARGNRSPPIVVAINVRYCKIVDSTIVWRPSLIDIVFKIPWPV